MKFTCNMIYFTCGVDIIEPENCEHYLIDDYMVPKVVQRNKEKGCVIASIEWLLRRNKVRIELKDKPNALWYESFQEIVINELEVRGTNPTYQSAVKIIEEKYNLKDAKIVFQEFMDFKKRMMKIDEKMEKGILAHIPIFKHEIVWSFKNNDKDPSNEIFYWDGNLKSYHIMPIIGKGNIVRDKGKVKDAGIIFLDLKEKPELKIYTTVFLNYFQQYYSCFELCWIEKTNSI